MALEPNRNAQINQFGFLCFLVFFFFSDSLTRLSCVSKRKSCTVHWKEMWVLFLVLVFHHSLAAHSVGSITIQLANWLTKCVHMLIYMVHHSNHVKHCWIWPQIHQRNSINKIEFCPTT